MIPVEDNAICDLGPVSRVIPIMMTQGRPVLVLGMHRSGTSYLASVLARMEVSMGESLLPADRGNPRGYFEDTSVLAFHKACLAARSRGRQTRADFLPCPDFRPAWSEEERAQARELVGHVAKEGLWGWKEPRTCLFLSEWLCLLPQARCVAVYRHPLDIFHSFLRRGDWSALFAPESVFCAAALYNGAILEAAKAEPERFLILNAGAAFADGAGLARDLALFLDTGRAAALPEFASSEFSSLPITETSHALFSAAYPDAAKAYDALQALCPHPVAFAKEGGNLTAESLPPLAAAARAGAGQALVEAFCLPLAPGELARLKAKIADDVDERIARLSGERDEYFAHFEKYKGLYENYFSAWKETDRTLAETRDWVNRDLLPKIERWRAQLKGLGVPFGE